MTAVLVRGQYRLSGSVLTHPARGDRAERTAAQVPPGLLRIVTDPEPDGPPMVLRTALAAWSSVPTDSTHHLVLQDDMVLADGALDGVLEAIAAAPDAALALFAIWDSRNGAAVRIGALRGAGWVRTVGEYAPCAALVLPRAVASGFGEHVRRIGADGWPDDILMQRYLRAEGVRCLIAVPNIAEHEDGPSIAGNAFRGPRRSACFLPVALPTPRQIVESVPELVPFFKNGVAQCIERAADGGWLHLETEHRLRLRGVRVETLSPPEMNDLDPNAARGVWLTGYALGLLARGDAAAPVDAAAMVAALRTIGPGGASQRPGEQPGEREQLRLADLAHRAVDAGRTDPLHPTLPCRQIELRSDGGPLTAHIAAYLAELGASVSLADGGADPRVRVDGGHLYGPGCGPEEMIGGLIWAALRSQPIVLTDDMPRWIRPVHVREVAESIAHGVAAGERAAYPLKWLAMLVAKLVRPVPVDERRTRPAAEDAAVTEPPELRFRLHQYAQWLAYEFRGT